MADFDLQSYLDTVNAAYMKEDVFRRLDQRQIIDSTIQHKELVKQLDVIKPTPGDRPRNLPKVSSKNWENLDWNNELLQPFSDMKSMDDLYDFFNIEVDFLNPNTTIWIKFKCDAPKCGHKEKLTTGGFSNINRYERMNIMY